MKLGRALSLRLKVVAPADEDENSETEERLFKYDFVIVVPKVSEKYMAKLKQRAEDAGFVTDLFESWALKGEQSVQFCRIGLPLTRCRDYAEAVMAPGRLHPQRLREACDKLDPPISFQRRALGGRTFAEVSKIQGLYPPFLHIFTPFRLKKAALFMPWVAHNYHKLQLHLLASPTELPDVDGQPCAAKGAGMNIRLMDQCQPGMEYEVDPETKHGPPIATFFLLHDSLEDKKSLRTRLYEQWIKGYLHKTWFPWRVPVHQLREYLGDQAGFYFLFLSTFTSYCVPLGFIGAVITVAVHSVQVSEELARQLPACIFTPFLVIFMSIFMIHFRRRQTTFAKEWGCFAWTSGKLNVRPDFRGVPQVDPIDGHIVVDFSTELRRRRQAFAWAIIALLLAVAIVLVIGSFALKVWSSDQPEGSFWYLYGHYIGTAINVVQVQAGNIVFTKIATRLTLYENWKTDPDYSNALISKLFLFKFINTFAAVYYAAFLKEVVEHDGCPGTGGCLDELAGTIMPIFISGAVMSLITQIAIPMLRKRQIQKRTGGDYGDDDIGRVIARRQFNELTDYDNMQGPIEDNLEIVLQFCYMACFGAAFPLSPFICAAANIMQLKQDGYKLLWLHRRVISMEVKNVGVWEDIYSAILHLAMPTNMGIFVFTCRVTDDKLTLAERWVVFFVGWIFYHCLLNALQKVFPPTSRRVMVQLMRQETYGMRVVDGVGGYEVFDEAKAEEDEISSKSLLEATHMS